MKNGILVGAAVLAASTWSASAVAGRADDTMNWATDREVAVVDPYYNNVRELVVMGHLGWDGLMFRNLETGEFEPPARHRLVLGRQRHPGRRASRRG